MSDSDQLEIEWLRAEIERLEGELKTCCDHENIWKHAQEMGYTKVIDEQKAEIERLKADRDTWEATCQTVDKKLQRAKAEIERLTHNLRIAKANYAGAEAEIERLRVVVDAAKDWFLDDSQYDDTEAALIMAVGNYLAMVERDASCLDSGCEEGSHKPWCDHANPAALEGGDG